MTPNTDNTDLNIPLFERANALIPGGVNSPVRAFKAVGGTPRFPNPPPAALRQPTPRRVLRGRQRPAFQRLHGLLGPDDPGAWPPGGARSGAAGSAGGPELWRPHRARVGTGRGHLAPAAIDADDPPGQF